MFRILLIGAAFVAVLSVKSPTACMAQPVQDRVPAVDVPSPTPPCQPLDPGAYESGDTC